MRKHWTFSILLWSMLLGSSPAIGASYTFTILEPPLARWSQALGINNAGDITGTYIDNQGYGHTFLYHSGVFTSIDIPDAVETNGGGINNNGDSVGGYFEGGRWHGYLYQGSQFISIDVPWPGYSYTHADGINDNGDIVGTYAASAGGPSFYGFLYRQGTFSSIASQAFGINNSGDIVGSSGVYHPDGSFTPINFPGATGTQSNGINNHGDIAGTYRDTAGVWRGFVFNAADGSFISIDVPFSNAQVTYVYGINDNRDIVGGYFDSSTYLTHGFLGTAKPPVSLAPATLWLGLKNSDDQGTQFDLRAEVYLNGTLVSDGLTRCITGVTRNPSKVKEVEIPFGSIANGAFASGDALSVTILARIGTNPDNTKCPGHANAVGLRLYYDAISRPSRFGVELAPDPMKDFFLHFDGTDFLENTPPTASTPDFKDSPSVNFAGGNPWKAIGTWSMTLP